VFRRISWLPGGGGLTAPLWTAGFRGVSAVVGACLLSLLVEFAPRTSGTPVATWCWQTEGRSAERVILGVDRAGSSCRSFNFLREEFLSAPIHSPLSGRLIGPSRLYPLAARAMLLSAQAPGFRRT
jgi:hypothetical protein